MRQLYFAVLVFSVLATAGAQEVNPTAFNGLRWRSIGPPRSGYVSAPAGVPGDPTTYYVGLAEGGVWKTTNAGTTWQPIFADVRVASVGAVAVAPSDPKILYVGTGNQSGWSFTIGKGIYKSIDAGRTWTHVGLSRSQYIGAIVVDPRNAANVLVAALGPRAAAAAGDERGVYRSTAAGQSWTRGRAADGAAGASGLHIDYAAPQIVYALLTPGGAPGAPHAAGPGAGAYKSTDGGVTWQAIGGRGLANEARISAFAVSSGTHGRRLYALAAAGGRPAPGPPPPLYPSPHTR